MGFYMPEVTIKQLFDVGAHLGHRPRFWNPKFAPYLYGKHNGIHIINLDKTLPMLKEALRFISDMVSKGGKILFVGTKRAASDSIEREANRCGMPYVHVHWLGGFLTNYKTVQNSIKEFNKLKVQIENNAFSGLNKKESRQIQRKFEKSSRDFEGICNLTSPPDAMFVIDTAYEEIAIKEARKLNIPIIAIIDTNNSTEGIDYPIPANDDAISSIRLYTQLVADTVLEGIEKAEAAAAEEAASPVLIKSDAVIVEQSAASAPSE